jgi:Xaa-Pro aminopeptidase
MGFRYFPKSEYEERWQKVHAEMKRRGHDVAVVFGKTSGVYERAGDMLYLTNFFSTHSGQEPDTVLWNGRGYSAVIMQQGQVPELITDEAEPRFDIIATDRFKGLYDPFKGVADSLKARGIKGRVAFVGSDFVPVKYARQLEANTPGIQFVPDDDLVRNVRMIKSKRELACFREGGEIVTKAHIAMMKALVSGKSESEAAGIAGNIIMKNGGTWHRIPISHGKKFSRYLESDPMIGFSTLKPKKGDIVHGFIYGPIFQGYWLDPGRTAVVGRKPSAGQRKLIEALVDTMHQLMNAIRPGVKFMDVAKLGDKLTQKYGYMSEVLKTNWPYYGHSNGCMWEAPYIETRLLKGDETFEKGMVASVEGFFDSKAFGTAAFETNYIVTAKGIEEITPVPHLWW